MSIPGWVDLPVLSQVVTPASHRPRLAFHAALRSGWHVAEVGEAVLAIARTLARVARVDREVLRWPQLIALPALPGLLHKDVRAGSDFQESLERGQSRMLIEMCCQEGPPGRQLLNMCTGVQKHETYLGLEVIALPAAFCFGPASCLLELHSLHQERRPVL